MLIKAQRAVFSSQIGENSSLFKGFGSDFVELREYTTGDDIKHIDWIISSKMDKPHVKIFHEEKELNITLVCLLNASLHFGIKKLKFETLKETLAILTFSCIKQQNAYSAYVYNKEIEQHFKKSKDIFSVRDLLERVDTTPLFKKTIDYKNLANNFHKRVSKRSLFFLLGDFFNAQELKLNSLAYKHELVVIIIRDRFEENPSPLGEVHVTDPQSGLSSTLKLDKKATVKIKTKVLKDDIQLLAEFNKNGIKHLKIYTDEDPLNKLLSFMSRL